MEGGSRRGGREGPDPSRHRIGEGRGRGRSVQLGNARRDLCRRRRDRADRLVAGGDRRARRELRSRGVREGVRPRGRRGAGGCGFAHHRPDRDADSEPRPHEWCQSRAGSAGGRQEARRRPRGHRRHRTRWPHHGRRRRARGLERTGALGGRRRQRLSPALHLRLRRRQDELAASKRLPEGFVHGDLLRSQGHRRVASGARRFVDDPDAG